MFVIPICYVVKPNFRAPIKHVYVMDLVFFMLLHKFYLYITSQVYSFIAHLLLFTSCVSFYCFKYFDFSNIFIFLFYYVCGYFPFYLHYLVITWFSIFHVSFYSVCMVLFCCFFIIYLCSYFFQLFIFNVFIIKLLFLTWSCLGNKIFWVGVMCRFMIGVNRLSIIPSVVVNRM